MISDGWWLMLFILYGPKLVLSCYSSAIVLGVCCDCYKMWKTFAVKSNSVICRRQCQLSTQNNCQKNVKMSTLTMSERKLSLFEFFFSQLCFTIFLWCNKQCQLCTKKKCSEFLVLIFIERMKKIGERVWKLRFNVIYTFFPQFLKASESGHWKNKVSLNVMSFCWEMSNSE